MAETPGTPKQEIKLFYCYAHEDKALRDELQVNLAGLRRQYQLTNWYDREILPGEKWEEAIDKNLSTADVILLLISPHFVDSDYCYGKEMQRVLERHHAGGCCVIPIMLRPTYWEETPLGNIQMLPAEARPITSWPNRDEAFHDVARGIGTAIKALLTSRAHKKWLDKGDALYNLGQYEEALIAYDQAISLDPNDIATNVNIGDALYKLKQYEEALATYDRAIGLDHSLVYAYMGKSKALYHLKQHEIHGYIEEAINIPDIQFKWYVHDYSCNDSSYVEAALQLLEQWIGATQRITHLKALTYCYTKGIIILDPDPLANAASQAENFAHSNSRTSTGKP